MNIINKVLLIDDDPVINMVHTHIIKKTNKVKEVVKAENGLEALNYLSQLHNKNFSQPELIFLDINMPVMNGWEFLKKYDQLVIDKKAIVVIFKTSKISEAEQTIINTMGLKFQFGRKPLTQNTFENITIEYFEEIHNS